MKDRWIAIAAIIGLTIISVVAMYFGINGTLRTTICVIIAGIAGLIIKNPFDKKIETVEVKL